MGRFYNILDFLIWGSFNIFIAAQECNNVFPQLFCGLRYDTEEKCSSAGCCWSGESCFIPTVSGYSYTESTTSESVTTGVLSLNSASGVFNSSDFVDLSLQVTLETNTRTHITISPVGVERWEVPEFHIPRPGGVFDRSESILPGLMLTETVVKSSPLSIVTTRSNTGVNHGLPPQAIFCSTWLINLYFKISTYNLFCTLLVTP